MAHTDNYVLSCDIGTTGCKTVLYRIGDVLENAGAAQAGYPLLLMDGGGAEQRGDDWWDAVCGTTRRVLDKTGVSPHAVRGMSFCCQMQGFIAVDVQGRALRNPMIYMDGRSTAQIGRHLQRGLLKVEGMNLFKLLHFLRVTGGGAATAKDPLWKYHWMKDNEPELFRNIYKWLDVKDYLNMRCTGRATMTPDSANITFVYDTRPGRTEWSRSLCRAFGVTMAHLPDIVQSAEPVGGLTDDAAAQLGLQPGTPVFGGGGDTTCITLGAGCTGLNDTHIYVGTSGWVLTNTDKRMVDVAHMIASILGAMPGRYNFVGEQDTSGVCLQWVKDHLALDEIGVYLKEHGSRDIEEDTAHLYELLNSTVAQAPPGAGGVIFTPWLHGNRAPAEDPYARAMFFNVGLNTGKRMLVRAVLEGVAYHKRWILEFIEKRVPRQHTLRFVGGGAKSEVWRQIMADVTGRTIQAVENPQDAGAMGAALISAVGLGLIPDLERAGALIPVHKTYAPDPANRAVYDKQYAVFKQLYGANKRFFKTLNAAQENE
jgi:xylulokinase